jgi:uncharacterized membrane protein
MGIRVIEEGGHLDPLGIVCLVLGLILWAAVMTTLVLLIMGLVRHLRHPKGVPGGAGQVSSAQAGHASEGPEALRVLDERYARGEINHKEYLERKGDLAKS